VIVDTPQPPACITAAYRLTFSVSYRCATVYSSAMDAQFVSAIAGSATALIAAGALWYAAGQVREARATRKAVAQPNVVVYVEMNAAEWRHLDLVVKNFGQTAAYGIKFEGLMGLDIVPSKNELTGETDTVLYLPETIAVLAPGQEWRTVWDSVVARKEYELRRQHQPELNLAQLRNVFEGKVHFWDTQNESYTNPIRLDTSTFLNTRRFVDNSQSEDEPMAPRRGGAVTRSRPSAPSGPPGPTIRRR
jgi:hypothetical protein